MSLEMPSAPPAASPAQQPPRCMVCLGSSRRQFSIAGIPIRQCESCGHQFAEIEPTVSHVQDTYGDEYFVGGGAGYADYLSDSQLLIERARYYVRHMSRYVRRGTMLDVGAAAGFTLRAFADAGWDGLGIEPNARMAEYARTQQKVAVEATSLEAWQGFKRFDLVTMLQVLPHFADPRAAIRRSAECLRPGGFLLIETWDRKSWAARVFGQNWHEYSPPSVLHWFSRATLLRLVQSEGLALVAAGRPRRWISLSHARSVLRDKAATSLFNRVCMAATGFFPERVAVPYPYDDLIWMLFRRGNVVDALESPPMTSAVEPAGALCK